MTCLYIRVAQISLMTFSISIQLGRAAVIIRLCATEGKQALKRRAIASWLLLEFGMEPNQGSVGEDARSQVMTAQVAQTRMVNGIDPVSEELRGEGTHGERGRSVDGDERTRAAGEEAAGSAPLPGSATGLAPQQSRDIPFETVIPMEYLHSNGPGKKLFWRLPMQAQPGHLGQNLAG